MTVRMTSVSTPAASMALSWSIWVMYSPAASSTSPSTPATSLSRQRPMRFSSTSPFSLCSGYGTPSAVPQSISRMMTSWATSTRRRVR